MTKDDAALVREALQIRFDRFRQEWIGKLTPQVNNNVAVPEVTVDNHIPLQEPPVVNIDIAGIEAAIDRLGERVAIQLATALTTAMVAIAEMLSQLVQVMAEQPAIEFKPEINLPESQVNVAAPKVTVAAPNVSVAAPITPKREKRHISIKHSDGTTSTLTEE